MNPGRKQSPSSLETRASAAETPSGVTRQRLAWQANAAAP